MPSRTFAASSHLEQAPMAKEHQKEIAMLKILLATGETALETFKADGSLIEADFVDDLERTIDRTRRELADLGDTG